MCPPAGGGDIKYRSFYTKYYTLKCTYSVIFVWLYLQEGEKKKVGRRQWNEKDILRSGCGGFGHRGGIILRGYWCVFWDNADRGFTASSSAGGVNVRSTCAASFSNSWLVLLLRQKLEFEQTQNWSDSNGKNCVRLRYALQEHTLICSCIPGRIYEPYECYFFAHVFLFVYFSLSRFATKLLENVTLFCRYWLVLHCCCSFKLQINILRVPTTQLAKMSIDLKFVKLTTDVLEK